MIFRIHNEDYILIPHARDRLDERIVSEWDIEETLRHPHKTYWDEDNQSQQYIKNFGKGKERYTLQVAVEKGTPNIIKTVIVLGE